jgi:hypothetical protein
MSANPHYTAVTCAKKAVDRARARRDAAEEKLAAAKADLDDAYKYLSSLEDHCTHRYPDGTSAWESGFMYGECTICGYNDL